MATQQHASKDVFAMTIKELIEYEKAGGESGSTSDLATALADALEETAHYLQICLDQIKEYSPDNEWIMSNRMGESLLHLAAQDHLT